MESVVAIAVLVIMGVAVTLFGLPFVDLIARLRPARPQRAASDMVQQQAIATAAAFVPLTMGDSGQRWPSEVPRRKTSMDQLPWPSQNWAENPFPASTTSADQHAATTTARKAPTRPMAPTPQPVVTPQPTRTRPKARPKRKAPRAAAQPAPQRAPTPQPASREAAPVTPPPSRPQAEAPAPQVSTEAILAIANDPSRGLASAVEYVREQTGWSFQRAAQHVALALRNHT